MNTRREDCFYFSEVTDYGGHIPFCGVTARLEDCPCRDCKNYISKSDAYQVVRKYQNGEIVAVRRGYWKEDGNIQICSECGEEHCWADYRAPYCETCGAKMIGEMQYKMLYHSAFPDGKDGE